MGVLLMLMTIGGLIVAGIMLAAGIFSQRKWLVKFTLGGVAIWIVFYAVLLVGYSLTSRDVTLETGQPKEYCGFYLDCHMHTAVTGVRTAKSIGDLTAAGQFYIVTVKVSSDARRAKLGLLTVDAHVVDASNREYPRDSKAEAQLPPQPDFEKQISPAESFEKEIVFDLPHNVDTPRLDVREGYGIDHVIEAVLVGDEDSFLHKRNYFDIRAKDGAIAVK